MPTVASSPAPNKRVPMIVPIGCGGFHGTPDLGPRLEAAALEGQRPQDFPPRLNQVQIGGVLGLKDKFPARMGQAKQQHIRSAVRRQVVKNRIDAMGRSGQPRLDLLQKVNPIRRGSAGIRVRQRFSRRGLKSAKDVPLAPAAIVNFLLGTSGWTGFGWGSGFNQEGLLPGNALGRFWFHFIQANYESIRRRLGVERLNRPLFSANAGSTRVPNHVSCLRHRKPSATRSSPIRLRLMAKCRCSFKYAANRSSVQLPKGKSSFCGSVSAVAMTSLTCPGVYVAGRPGRASSWSPSMPPVLNRCTHSPTVGRLTCNWRAMAEMPRPWLANRIILARSTNRALAVRVRANWATAVCSSAVSSRSLSLGRVMSRLPFLTAHCKPFCRMHHLVYSSRELRKRAMQSCILGITS